MSARIAWWLAALLLVIVPRANAAIDPIEQHGEWLVVYLRGTPYELGRQHGELLRDSVGRSVAQVLGYFRGYLKVPVIRAWLANWWLDRSWGQSLPSIPADYLEELRGLSDGSGVPLRELWRMHAIPDRTYACSNFAAWGRATSDGSLIHVRNLDWNIDAGVQRHPAVFVVQPRGKQAYVNVGWAGFIGVLTGINERGVSIGQVGADTVDVSYRGIPMVFLMRKVMEEARDLDGAIQLIERAPRTVGTNYLIADAHARRAVAVETTHQFAAVFHADDPKEHDVAYARPIPDAVFRSDTAADPTIRERQYASGGDPKKAGVEPVSGSAYEVRYLGQAAGILAYYGKLDVQAAQAIARAVSPDSNIQSVIMQWPAIWVANAHGTTPAAQRPYERLDLAPLFERAAR